MKFYFFIFSLFCSLCFIFLVDMGGEERTGLKYHVYVWVVGYIFALSLSDAEALFVFLDPGNLLVCLKTRWLFFGKLLVIRVLFSVGIFCNLLYQKCLLCVDSSCYVCLTISGLNVFFLSRNLRLLSATRRIYTWFAIRKL